MLPVENHFALPMGRQAAVREGEISNRRRALERNLVDPARPGSSLTARERGRARSREGIGAAEAMTGTRGREAPAAEGPQQPNRTCSISVLLASNLNQDAVTPRFLAAQQSDALLSRYRYIDL